MDKPKTLLAALLFVSTTAVAVDAASLGGDKAASTAEWRRMAQPQRFRPQADKRSFQLQKLMSRQNRARTLRDKIRKGDCANPPCSSAKKIENLKGKFQ